MDLADYCYDPFYVNLTSTTNTKDCSSELCSYLHSPVDLAADVDIITIYLQSCVFDIDNSRASFLRTMTIEGRVTDLGIETTLALAKEGTGSLALIAVLVSSKQPEDAYVTFTNLLVTVKSTSAAIIYVLLFGVVTQNGCTAQLILNIFTFSAKLCT